MANAMREQIGGTSPQDIMKINENFESMWYKVHGDVDFVDTNKGLKNKIMTQWIPVQGSGNLDSNYPLDIRFYIPPNVDSIKSTNFSASLSNYRMDSGVANGGGGVENVDINMSLGSTTVGVASVGGGGTTQPVAEWATNIDNNGLMCPKTVAPNTIKTDDLVAIPMDYDGVYFNGFKLNSKPTARLLECTPYDQGSSAYLRYTFMMDLFKLQHVHQIPAHSHSISLSPHSHSGNGKVTLSPHTHPLNEGIKVSTKPLQQTIVHINNEPISILDGATQNVNNIDISQHIKVGEWNVIRCTSSSVARIELYGVIELIIKG